MGQRLPKKKKRKPERTPDNKAIDAPENKALKSPADTAGSVRPGLNRLYQQEDKGRPIRPPIKR
jgi:hypothetical protein